MADVVIAGIGQIPVGEHWEISLRSLAAKAGLAAIKDAGGRRPQAMYIGNFLASTVTHQANLGALLAENMGLHGIEAYTIEAAGASGAAAFRVAALAVASGYVETALVVGVEKFTDMVGAEVDGFLTQSSDYDYEAVQGLTLVGQAGLVAQRYFYETGAPREALAAFPLLAHANAVNNPNAMYRKALRRELYERADLTASPLNLFDAAPYADGAAAVILTRADRIDQPLPHPLVRVLGSSVAIDTLALHDRHDLLGFRAVTASTERACRQAGLLPGDVDFFELCDAFSIYAVLSLEAAGFAARGEGWKLAENGGLSLKGKLPILTQGGMKARGNPLGAAGVYQLVEAAQQLRGQAGANQIAGARRGLVQCLGGPASTVVTHVLERMG